MNTPHFATLHAGYIILAYATRSPHAAQRNAGPLKYVILAVAQPQHDRHRIS
jgi:hypothetical protein